MADDYPNSGRMFKNSRKEKDTHPDGDGNGEITCSSCGHRNAFFINGWRKDKDKNGDPWWSFSFKAKTKQPMKEDDTSYGAGRGSATGQAAMSLAPGAKAKPKDYTDDEIPF